MKDSDPDSDTDTAKSPRGCCSLRRLLAACAAILSIGWLILLLRQHIVAVVEAVESAVTWAGPWGPAMYAALLAVFVLAPTPISVFEVLSGHLFSFSTALAACVAGKSLGAAMSFIIGRTFARPLAQRLVRSDRRVASLASAVLQHPFRTTLLVRFAYIPAMIKNYGWSVVGVSFPVFMGATLIEAPAYSVPMVLLGGRVHSLAEIAAGKAKLGLEGYLVLGFGVCMLAVLCAGAFVLQRQILSMDERNTPSDDTEVIALVRGDLTPTAAAAGRTPTASPETGRR